ncbi:hypothetical protein BDN70DRAFT_804409 [Pholiota conissans]|uniref:F-box domain-containing protein n=1 Tax=Pholiota conissans TaxID=109636 RepID=A0A9P5Z663_9AGAR|nr:hypothetical protein BDN70DRAFT_804409 [Pholiota conissans]
MSATLPYDIWCIIARFVPEDDVVQLYAVNSAFFHYAMKIAYREVQISHLDDESTLRCVKNFGRPAVAHYVQSLILRPHALGYYMYGASDFRGFLAESLWRVQGRVDGRANPSGPAAARILLRGITKMQNIKSLKVVHFCPDTYPYFVLALPLVNEALVSSGSRIQTLSLEVPLESYEHILPQTLKLSSLATLNVVMQSHHDFAKANYSDSISTTLVPFILRHRHTLKHLSIDIQYRHGSADLSSIFSGLNDFFSRLISLTMSIPFEYVYKPGVHTILANHSGLIQELKLVFYPPFLRQDFLLPPDQLFSLPIFQVPLPQLKVLDLDLWMWPETERRSATRNLVNYLFPVQEILSVLILRHHLFCADDLRILLDTSRGIFSHLARLQISVRYLCVDLFDILASQLPTLSRLDISFDTLGGNISDSKNAETSYLTNVQNFHLAMQQRRYTNWTLRHLELSLMGNAAGRWEECCGAIAQALPNIYSFNGISKDQSVRNKV